MLKPFVHVALMAGWHAIGSARIPAYLAFVGVGDVSRVAEGPLRHPTVLLTVSCHPVRPPPAHLPIPVSCTCWPADHHHAGQGRSQKPPVLIGNLCHSLCIIELQSYL